ncbi:methionyl-tRNA formyltransferase [Legionella beliardensis]|uniref:Methionyl-tRNA formyltransferase n=1 Tax=Legionella beliardensis TaxID=91822 RepID=A0A378ICF7_9GAMM|nr:methionyl-tRNA formyltransferase [Legionella beliardensis]STX29984.1 methionyl-tRNA formyltransferase [Legionella beliardensis]
MADLKIVFAGTPEFGLPCLDALFHSTHQVLAIYTQPDRPAGRGRKLQPSAVKTWAITHQLPVFQPVNFRNASEVTALADLKPDLLIVIAYGLILPRQVLSIPRLGCVNVHASLLPRWRGASPIQQAILHGDEYSGVTIMQMDVGMDTGDMLAKAQYRISPNETAGSLHDKLAELAVKPLLETVDALAAGHSHPVPQDNDLATYAGKINKQDALINWQQKASDIVRQICAYNPWPIAYTYAGSDPIRIHQANIEQAHATAKPGTIVAIDKQGVLVATSDALVRVLRLQFAGGKVLSVADWFNSGRLQLEVGQVLQ